MLIICLSARVIIISSNFTMLRITIFMDENVLLPNLKRFKDVLMQYVWNQRGIGSF